MGNRNEQPAHLPLGCKPQKSSLSPSLLDSWHPHVPCRQSTQHGSHSNPSETRVTGHSSAQNPLTASPFTHTQSVRSLLRPYTMCPFPYSRYSSDSISCLPSPVTQLRPMSLFSSQGSTLSSRGLRVCRTSRLGLFPGIYLYGFLSYPFTTVLRCHVLQ